MPGALALTEPKHLLEKLKHELRAFSADRSDSYAAINALRDAYHLREWIWHSQLENDFALQVAVIGVAGSEQAWNEWVIRHFPDFPIVRDLCNGAKHWEAGEIVRDTHRGGFDSKVLFFDNPHSGFDDNGFHVEVEGGRIVSVSDLAKRVEAFWIGLFKQFPQLG